MIIPNNLMRDYKLQADSLRNYLKLRILEHKITTILDCPEAGIESFEKAEKQSNNFKRVPKL